MNKTCLCVLFFLSVLVCGCVSRSLPDERFQNSNLLSGPGPSIAVEDADRFSFAAVGDLHVSGGDVSRLRRIIKDAESSGDAFIALLGDLTDKGERGDFLSIKALLDELGWTNKTACVLGNHDIFEEGWSHFSSVLGANHYAFSVGNAKFIVIDTADGTLGTLQTDWLKSELVGSVGAPVFILSHYLPFVYGERTYLKFSNEVESTRLMKWSMDYGVKAFLGGHFHGYANGKVAGVDYVTVGGGGGVRMGQVPGFFYLQVRLSGQDVEYTVKNVE